MSSAVSSKEKDQINPPRLPFTGVDTHAHLDREEFNSDLKEVLERAEANGVSHIGQVFLSFEDYQFNRVRFAERGNIFMLLGIHPHDADKFTSAMLDQIQAAFEQDSRLKAVGEIGLDFYGNLSSREGQFRAFEQQLALAARLDRPVVVHSREAFEQTMSRLLAAGFSGRPVLWHCFGGGPDEAEQILGHGWHISIPGTITFPKNDRLREAVASIPVERLVLETDCPYLTPVPWRGRRNDPSYLPFTGLAVAEAKGMAPAELWTACGDTARKFFKVV